MSKLIQQLNDLIPHEVKVYTPVVLIGIGTVWVLGKLCIKTISNISQKRMLSRWSNTNSLVIERKSRRNRKNISKPREVKTEADLKSLKQLDGRKPPNVWNTVIFFPDFTPELPKSSTNKLISYFENARMSIHLCMYVCSHPLLGNIIQKKYKEGLVVQVVTDYDTFTAHNNCGAKFWKKAGIEVRMKCTGYLMHHKFAIIDEEAVLTGSLNWTKQGLSSNQENVMISTNKTIVDLYMGEFQELWGLCEDTDNNTDNGYGYY